MCTETTIIYNRCKTKGLHTRICAAHIAHTHQQIDDRPCRRKRYKTSMHSRSKFLFLFLQHHKFLKTWRVSKGMSFD
jgi:hypothetical protein